LFAASWAWLQANEMTTCQSQAQSQFTGMSISLRNPWGKHIQEALVKETVLNEGVAAPEQRGMLSVGRDVCYTTDCQTQLDRMGTSHSHAEDGIWPNDPAWFTPSVVILICCNKTAQALPQSGSLQDQQRQIFDQYVQGVEKTPESNLFAVQTFSSPVRLAQQMQ